MRPITPAPRRLHLRHDALVAAAATVGSVRCIAKELDGEGSDYFVATVGILSVEPSASNIVPGRCRLVIDARTTDPVLTTRFVEALDRESCGRSESRSRPARRVRDAFGWSAGRL